MECRDGVGRAVLADFGPVAHLKHDRRRFASDRADAEQTMPHLLPVPPSVAHRSPGARCFLSGLVLPQRRQRAPQRGVCRRRNPTTPASCAAKCSGPRNSASTAHVDRRATGTPDKSA